MEQALKCLDSFNPELAAQFFERALQIEPNNADVLDEFADLLLANGNIGKASRLLQHSISVAPETGHSKYMNMGQISEGKDAAQCFEKGVMLIQRQLADPSVDVDVKQALCRELAAGQVSIAELYMSDLCFEVDAEQKCEQAVQLACEADPGHADAHHTMASFWISKGDNERALGALQKGYEIWKAPEIAGGEINEQGEGGDEDDDMDLDEGNDMMMTADLDDASRPSYASRLAAGKMFLELGDPETAGDIFTDLVLENEDDPEIYFLTALTQEDPSERHESLEQALKKIEHCEQDGQTDLEHLKKAVLNAVQQNQ